MAFCSEDIHHPLFGFDMQRSIWQAREQSSLIFQAVNGENDEVLAGWLTIIPQICMHPANLNCRGKSEVNGCKSPGLSARNRKAKIEHRKG